jgi:hypothetical protein
VMHDVVREISLGDFHKTGSSNELYLLCFERIQHKQRNISDNQKCNRLQKQAPLNQVSSQQKMN